MNCATCGTDPCGGGPSCHRLMYPPEIRLTLPAGRPAVGLPYRLSRRGAVICAGVAIAAVACAVQEAFSFVAPIPLGLLAAIAAVELVTGLFAIRWLHDARVNLDDLPGATPRWRAGWAIGAWFIPVVGLFIGAAVIADIARNSVPVSEPAARRRLVRWTWWWCACFVGSNLPGVVWGLAGGSATSPSGLVSAIAVSETVAWMVSAALFVAVLREIARRHDVPVLSRAAALRTG